MSAAVSSAPAQDAPAAPPTAAERDSNRVRFETELEFVQCLANPFYLQSLAQQNLLTSEPFLNYLSYLLYFRQPRYARFLQYPQALHHLGLLTAPGESGASFRRALKDQPLMAQELAGKQVAHWAGWREREGVVPAAAAAPAGVNGGETENGHGEREADGGA
ncbi:hypothetical protein JCM10207_006942 [Rhodosporidiobolus poonsookiae]